MKAKEKKTEKKNEWVHKSYWEEFHKTYPDLSGFRSFVASDPELVKIFKCYAVPSIWGDIRKFPFVDKIEELETVSESYSDYLTEAYWKEKDKQKQDWLEYLGTMFDMVRSTVLLKKKLDSDNEKLQSKYDQDQILDIVEWGFRNYISVNETITSGNAERMWIKGMWYPLFTRVVHRKGKDVRAMIYHYFPDPNNIKSSFEWDAYWVQAFKKHQYDDLFDSPAKTFTIQHYYDGKPLLSDPFKVSIAQKYKPLLLVSAKEMKKILRGDFEMALQEAKIALFEAIKKYDPKEGPVANYFKLYLKQYYPGNLFEKLSTEKRKIKMEHSGGSLDDFIKSDDEDAERRMDFLRKEGLDLGSKWVTPANKNPEEEMIEHEDTTLREEAILNEARKDKELMRILESEGVMSVAERQYKSRKLKEIRERLGIRS